MSGHADAEPLAEQVSRLIQRLDSPALGERQDAFHQLEQLGPDVLPLLPANDDREFANRRDALDRLRRLLERQLSERSIRASDVELAVSGNLPTVCEKLSELTGTRFEVDETLSSRQVSVDWRRIPYWGAIKDLTTATRSECRWKADRAVFQLLPISEEPPASAVSGPFRWVVRSGSLRRLPQNSHDWLLRCDGLLQVEPRLRPLFAGFATADWTARADRVPLAPWNPEAKYELNFGEGACEVGTQLEFLWPVDRPVEPWSLQGRMVVHLAAGRERLVFAGADLSRGRRQRRGAVLVRMGSVEFNADDEREAAQTPATLRGRVRITVDYEQGGPAFESYRAGLFHRNAWLEATSGQRVEHHRFEVLGEADGAVSIEYEFENLSPPATGYRFVYEAPTLLLDVPAEFEMRRLPVTPPP